MAKDKNKKKGNGKPDGKQTEIITTPPPEPEGPGAAPTDPRPPSTAIARSPAATAAGPLSVHEAGGRAISPLDMPPQVFKAAVERRQTNRDTMTEWIRSQLVEGVDFGRIWSKKRQEWSRPSLWKPGAEKICGLLGVIPTFPDHDKYVDASFNGQVIELVVLRCEIVDEAGNVLAKGVGSRRVDYGDVNKALKMASKSAHIDATLRLAGLSEIFTQDIEDQKGNGKDEKGAPYWVSQLWKAGQEAGMSPDQFSACRQNMGIEAWETATAGQIGGMYGKVKAVCNQLIAKKEQEKNDDSYTDFDGSKRPAGDPPAGDAGPPASSAPPSNGTERQPGDEPPGAVDPADDPPATGEAIETLRGACYSALGYEHDKDVLNFARGMLRDFNVKKLGDLTMGDVKRLLEEIDKKLGDAGDQPPL
jgi:hypothetical protein